jgi:hypothetical protein
MISEKFKKIPVEEDTKILSRKEVRVGEYDAIDEEWVWEGIRAALSFLMKISTVWMKSKF